MALSISEDLIKEINKKEKIVARVHSVFNSAFNLENENKLITILSKGKIISPMSIVIDNKKECTFKELGLNNKCTFIIDRESIVCRELNIFISLNKATIFNPHIKKNKFYVSQEEFIKNLNEFGRNLMKYGKLDFFIPLMKDLQEAVDSNLNIDENIKSNFENEQFLWDNSYFFIKDRLIAFIEEVKKCNTDNIHIFADKIIGFGLGLTPSIDDFVGGLMISLIYLGHYYNLDILKIIEFNNKLISRSIYKTTRVSSEMLKHSANGIINEGVEQLMNALLCKNDSEKLTEDIQKVISFGETSGSDTAFGLYLGCKIITDIRYRRSWENEAMCRY